MFELNKRLRIWYKRKSGGRDVLRLAIPIILSYGSMTVMTITDRLCLAWYGETEMNAAFQAGCLFWCFLFFPQGIGVFVNTFVSQYFGAEQKRKIGLIVWQGVFLGLTLGMFFVFATPFVSPFFKMVGQSDELAALELDYWLYMTPGAIATLGLEPFVSFFNGIRESKIVMKVTALGFVINMVLDPLLIFGIGGHLRWGVAGASIATSIAICAKLAVFAWCAYKRDANGEFGLRSSIRVDFHEMKRLVKYGSMSAVQTSAEHWFYTIFVLTMGWIGEAASCATAIAYNLNALLYMPAVGFGLATAALVGNRMGEGRPKLAARATYTSLALSSVIAGVFSILFLTCPSFFVDLYTARNPEQYVEVRPIAINILRIVGVYLLFDAYNLITASALRGAGDAKFIMNTTLCVVAIILTALYVGVFRCGLGVYWCWSLQVAFLVMSVAVFATRFKMGKWRDKALVEVATR